MKIIMKSIIKETRFGFMKIEGLFSFFFLSKNFIRKGKGKTKDID